MRPDGPSRASAMSVMLGCAVVQHFMLLSIRAISEPGIGSRHSLPHCAFDQRVISYHQLAEYSSVHISMVLPQPATTGLNCKLGKGSHSCSSTSQGN